MVEKRMRPFFNYFGAKWRLAPRYPSPDHDVVIEPFAGAAGYSIRNYHKKVILCDADPIIAGVWRYLIHAKASEILSLPLIRPGESVDDLKIPEEARWLVGFWLNGGAESPRKSPSKWMREGISPGSFWGERVRSRIASQVEHIRHWRVINCSYEDCPIPNRATWFVDPPYEIQGKNYRFGSKQIDYEALAQWCQSLPGQVIVCEAEGATWLPFDFLAEAKTARSDRRAREVVWISSDTGDGEG